MDKEKILLAGKIALQVRDWIKPQIKKDMLLLELAEKIEDKIVKLGGKPAFPTNLGINDMTAHYTPAYNDEAKAKGLLKIDFGVCVDGWLSDTAFSVDLENSEENKKLIEVAEKALENAIEIINSKTSLGEVGKIIQQTIESKGLVPIANLTGHSIEKYELHSGKTIPNIANKNPRLFGTGIFAIEPFVTKGNGRVYEGKPSGIYSLQNTKNTRSQIAREVLEFISEEYSTLPFCSRWIVKKFGTKSLFGLRELEKNGNLHQYPQLIESSHNNVAQSEHTIFIEKDKTIVTTG
ncbi:MAG: type II methionyl aminopeptidase [Nanoarchaeota archaeon]|nr:type II methionyl aminopeptidase [Nanoarchaeota archaeon]